MKHLSLKALIFVKYQYSKNRKYANYSKKTYARVFPGANKTVALNIQHFSYAMWLSWGSQSISRKGGGTYFFRFYKKFQN